MNKRVKLGIVGCGPKGAQVMYAPILRFLQNGKVTALMDSDTGALDYMKGSCPDAAMYTDYEQFLEHADVDAVIIATPVQWHHSHVIQAAHAGKHVLCEKPMARTLAECDAMISACATQNVTLMLAFMKRFDQSFLLAKHMLDGGELGRIIQVRCEFSWHIPDDGDEGWRAKRATGGGMLQDHGSHTFDLCRWWLGEIITVSAAVRIVRPEREVEDLAVVTLEHQGGAISTHTVSGVSHQPLRETYVIDGTTGSLEMTFGPAWSYTAVTPFRMTLYRQGHMAQDVTPRSLPNLDDELRAHSHYLREIEAFCACIQNGTPALISGVDGRSAIEVVNAAYLSSWQHTKVSMPQRTAIDLEKYFVSLKASTGY
ncbi:MAG TPA: Gfo/Idh/MocA family oxidoreductase [Anaerolineae bacterium]|jgi:predicted dehydrogenase